MMSEQGARGCERLIREYSDAGAFEALEAELPDALLAIDAKQQVLVLTSLAEAALARGEARQVIPLCSPLLENPELSSEALDVLERLSEAAEDADVLRRTLELQVKRAAQPATRARALERLGDFFDAWQQDTGSATKSWRAAALEFSSEPTQLGDSRRLYERVLATAPSDTLSATRLVELCAAAGDWSGAAEAFDALLRSAPDAEKVASLLVLLEPYANGGDDPEQFVALVDAARWQFGKALDSNARRLSE
ncbi:MAG TPA: tetratricopeptide repeat protein, partial [Polyangiaceae bacterium]|nr:tetratricopeptide repeat protein [Polyangiaceae bacterium]